MHRVLNCFVAIFVAAFASSAHAGMPRGAVLSADEQDADATSGVTTAAGNAEIRIEAYRIVGRADRIELNPVRNEIQFTGHALITVRDERYESDAVTCSLDFNTCAVIQPSQSIANENATATAPALQAMPPPSGVGAAAPSP